jgi:arylsulfatase A-like enzyme
MSRRPNILFVFSDQHRAQAMGCAGDPNAATPNLDRLAAEGTRFANAYANTPLCAPFRASLYTGRYITTHGVTSLHRPLLPVQPELPELLRAAGYRTCHYGKWHLAGGAGPCHFVSPYFRPGWDEWRGWENSNEPFATAYSEGDLPRPLLRMEGYQTDELTDWTLAWLDGLQDDRPWFHVMSIEPPHPPCEAPPPYMALYADRELAYRPNVAREAESFPDHDRRLRGYYAQIANLDDNLGRVLAKLEAKGMLDETMIWYFSDHGDLMGSHGRGQKSRPEEESSGIPLIIRWPGTVPAGAVSEALISVVDFLPTLLGALGLPVPEGVEGADLSRCLADPAAPGAESVLLQYETSFWPPAPHLTYRGVRRGAWKLVRWLEPGTDQLYDLESDPYEQENRIADPACAARRAALDAHLAERLDALGDDFLARRADRRKETP